MVLQIASANLKMNEFQRSGLLFHVWSLYPLDRGLLQTPVDARHFWSPVLWLLCTLLLDNLLIFTVKVQDWPHQNGTYILTKCLWLFMDELQGENASYCCQIHVKNLGDRLTRLEWIVGAIFLDHISPSSKLFCNAMTSSSESVTEIILRDSALIDPVCCLKRSYVELWQLCAFVYGSFVNILHARLLMVLMILVFALIVSTT